MMERLQRLILGLRKHKRFAEIFNCIRETQQWPKLIPAYLAHSRLGYPFEFSTREQSNVLLQNWDDLTTVWHVFFGHEYHVPRNSKAIVDLGANIGAFTIWAANRCPTSRILSFEPFPPTFERLKANITRNDLDRRVDCVQMAVSGHDGFGQFEGEPTKRSYCRKLVGDAPASNAIQVECITLASLLQRFNFEEIDCLKMDVEGAEYDICLSQSAETLRKAKTITLEYHNTGDTPLLWKKLDDSGFRRVMYSPGGWSGVAAFERIG